jgi:hypothetical protein
LVLGIESIILAFFVFILTILEFKQSKSWFTSADEAFLKFRPRRMAGPENV